MADSVKIHQGDCRVVLQGFDADTFDSIVTDPPYELGFIGKAWDRSGVAFDTATWHEALRVAKPGAYLAAFGGTRTFHRMATAIEDAGWELRDTLMWVYGSGFPKSKNGEWGGTALKSAFEPIVLARKAPTGPLAVNFAAHGTGGLNIDACRVESESMRPNTGRGALPRRHGDEQRAAGTVSQPHALGRWPANLLHDGSDEVIAAFPDAPGQQAPINLDAPSEKTANVYGRMRREGEASSNAENGGAVGFRMRPGARRIDSGSAARFFYCAKASTADREAGCHDLAGRSTNDGRAATADSPYLRGESLRLNHHPTVKPTELMRWLLRLVTPAGGVSLDPFFGSGTTGRAALMEGLRVVGVELELENCELAAARMRLVQTGLAFGDAA